LYGSCTGTLWTKTRVKTQYDTLLDDSLQSAAGQSRLRLGLALVWSRDELSRIGEVVLIPPEGEHVIGRAHGDPPPGALLWQRQRPGDSRVIGMLRSPRLSRRQLIVSDRQDGSLQVSNVGRPPMSVNGRPLPRAVVRPGDLIEVERRLLLLCVERPLVLPGELPPASFGFGQPDDDGFVGESPVTWTLRESLRFIARRMTHVLILGESGTGKELAAGTIHRHSQRSRGPLISRNAATLPEGVLDAELFGNLKNYPNPGTPDRPGLIGAAHRGSLFLDEIGEMPETLQSHLLRVLDNGEYQRIGESRMRHADFRLLAATNRAPESLKHDVLARLKLRIVMPGLNTRAEDVPLLARHLLRRMVAEDPELADRFFEGGPGGEPRMTPALVTELLRHHYTTHVRELEGLLWKSVSVSRKGWLECPPKPEPSPAPGPAPEGADTAPLSAEQIRAALDAAGGVKTRAAELLGLRNRFQLLRLLKKHNIH